MKLLIVDGDNICMEMDDVEDVATIKTADGGVALSPLLRSTLCAFFTDGILPDYMIKTRKNNVTTFPNYHIRGDYA